MDRDSFVFYRSFYESISQLGNESQLKIYQAILEYQFNGTEPKLEGIDNAIWLLIKPQLDANNKRYNDGCKGGRPKKETTGSKTKKTTGYSKTKTTGYENQKPNVNENDNENDNENVNDNENEIEDKSSIKKKEEAFKKFVEMRKKIKKPITDEGIKLAMQKLEKMYPGDYEMQTLCINQSVENSWQGLFEVRDDYLKLYAPTKVPKRKVAIVDTEKVLSLNEL